MLFCIPGDLMLFTASYNFAVNLIKLCPGCLCCSAAVFSKLYNCVVLSPGSSCLILWMCTTCVKSKSSSLLKSRDFQCVFSLLLLSFAYKLNPYCACKADYANYANDPWLFFVLQINPRLPWWQGGREGSRGREILPLFHNCMNFKYTVIRASSAFTAGEWDYHDNIRATGLADREEWGALTTSVHTCRPDGRRDCIQNQIRCVCVF